MKGTNKSITIGLIFLALLLSGCAAADEFTSGFLGEGQQTDQNNTNAKLPISDKVELNPYSVEPEKLTYYFCDERGEIYALNPDLGKSELIASNGYELCQKSLATFVAFTSQDSGLRCQFPALEDELVAEQIVELANKANVKTSIVFGKAFTMKFCETGCLPVEESFFTYMLAENVGVQFAEGVNESYCVNDKGVWFGSFVPSKRHNPINSSAYIVYNEQLVGVFNARFREIWEN